MKLGLTTRRSCEGEALVANKRVKAGQSRAFTTTQLGRSQRILILKAPCWVFLFMSFLSGCSSDLFHDTDWPTACEIDPEAEGCGGDGGTQDAEDGGTGE